MKHTIAIISSGIYSHPDLKDRIIGFKDLVNDEIDSYDDFGQGTFVAGYYAGSGEMNAKYRGIYPDAALVGIKIVDSYGGLQNNVLKAATRWLIENKGRLGIDMACLVLPASCQSIKELATKFTQEITNTGIEVLENPISDLTSTDTTMKKRLPFNDVLMPSSAEYIQNGGKVDIVAPGINPYYISHNSDKGK